MGIIKALKLGFDYQRYDDDGNVVDMQRAVNDVDLDIKAGEFVAVLGHNGSGKSTLAKHMNALLIPTEGTMLVDGIDTARETKLWKVRQKAGMVFQNPDNQIIGTVVEEDVGFGPENMGVPTDDIWKRVNDSLEKVGMTAYRYQSPNKLSGGQKQRVAIAGVMAMRPRCIILDEPTASLNEDDSKALLDLLLKFKKQGMTSIIISHKLNEISYVADKITVIRDGSTIETLDKNKDDFSEQRIIQGMVGREMTDRFPKRPNVKIGDVSMEIKNWNVYHPLYTERKVVNNVSFKVHKGEVVGISGLMGAGRTELAMSIFGKSYGTKISGQVFMNGKEVKLNTVQEAIDNKLAYVTEDRKGNGLILSKSIKMNTTLANMSGISNGKVIDTDKEYAVAEEYRKKLKTKCPTVEQNVGNLSGGNQQKVLLAKWMFAEPDILILDEPTRGIDVGAKYEIYCIINDLVAAGKSVIMISSELPEVLGMSDRIYIMNEGRFVGEVSGEEATSELIMSRIVKSGKGE